MKPATRRKTPRIDFSRSISAQVMAVDGSWQRACTISDVSESGARIAIKGSIEGLQIKEFFLLLSSTGPAHRRCELAWIKGAELGARFIQTPTKRSGQRASGNHTPSA